LARQVPGWNHVQMFSSALKLPDALYFERLLWYTAKKKLIEIIGCDVALI
jgi:hypothetical protein